MNKEQSLQLKGAAILMMLWLHLFNTAERVAECTSLINYFNGKPLAYALARVCGMCVPIYLFISGYGMAKAQDLGTSATLRRLWRVYSRFWLVFAIFIPLACRLCPNAYPESWKTFVLNLLSLDVSYNAEWWFMLPWVFLIVAARWIVPFVKRNGMWTNIAVFIVSFALLIFHDIPFAMMGDTIFSAQLSRLMVVMPAFYIGICMGSHGLRFARKLSLQHTAWPSLVMLLLCMVRGMLGPSSVNVLFAVPLIILFTICSVPQWLQSVLAIFGRYSIYMWLTHTFYAYYLFHDEIYALRYPIVMYLVLVVASLVTAVVLDRIYRFMESLISRKQRI